MLVPSLAGPRAFQGLSSPSQSFPFFCERLPRIISTTPQEKTKKKNGGNRFFIVSCYNSTDSATETTSITRAKTTTAPLLRKRKRYRKMYPGESEGITEEMRFVAMKLRNNNGSSLDAKTINDDGGESLHDKESDAQLWTPSMEGLLKYLVDSKLVFNTLDRIVDESDHVAFAYFRKTGLERSEALSKDLEWFSQKDVVIPPPCNPGVSYAKYLEQLAEKSAALFLCHFYNIYFAHTAGGQVIAKQVSQKLLIGRELEFCRWEEDVQELLKDVREKLNNLGEHWTRNEKNKCLREAAKSFQFSGQIVRLIIS